MGALPKQKRSHSKQGRKRAHMALVPPQLVTCSNCGNKRLSHRVCGYCGYYKDEEIVQIRQRKEADAE